MTDPRDFGRDRFPNEFGMSAYRPWETDNDWGWAAAIAVVLVLLAGIAIFAYGGGDMQRSAATNTDMTTGQSTRPAAPPPIQP